MLGVELGEDGDYEAATAEFKAEVIELVGGGCVGVHHMLSYAHCISHSVWCQVIFGR
jgi:hypothetical protein